MTGTADVLVVGAGLAGLCCARQLAERGVSTVADGRVSTRVAGDPRSLDRDCRVRDTC